MKKMNVSTAWAIASAPFLLGAFAMLVYLLRWEDASQAWWPVCIQFAGAGFIFMFMWAVNKDRENRG